MTYVIYFVAVGGIEPHSFIELPVQQLPYF